jgi:TMEM175 potassium channel family protein
MAGEPESLDQDEGLAARDRRHSYDRLIMLSDGVFAIAITLLALDIRTPAGWNRQLETLWPALAPELSAFVMSFLVITIYWLLHRRFVAMLVRVDIVATAFNLAMLGLIALLPAATRIAGESNSNLPVLELYAALVVAIGVALGLFWGWAALVARLAFPEVSARARWTGFLTPLLAPPLALAGTIGAGVPRRAVPFVLVGIFVVLWVVFQRLMWAKPAPSRPAAKEAQAGG